MDHWAETGDRKIATVKLVLEDCTQKILPWVRVRITVRFGGNLPGGNFPISQKATVKKKIDSFLKNIVTSLSTFFEKSLCYLRI